MRVSLFFVWVCLLFSLAGCAHTKQQETPPLLVASEAESISLVDIGYASADVILKNLKVSLDKEKPIFVGSFVDIKRMEKTNNFGRMLSEIVASRLSQKGYAIVDLRLRDGTVLVTEETDYVASEEMGYITEETDYITNEVGYITSGAGYATERAGEFLLSRKTRQEAITHNAQAVVTGTYARARDELYVSLRLLHTVTGQILSSYDFRVPLTQPLRAMFHSPYW